MHLTLVLVSSHLIALILINWTSSLADGTPLPSLQDKPAASNEGSRLRNIPWSDKDQLAGTDDTGGCVSRDKRTTHDVPRRANKRRYVLNSKVCSKSASISKTAANIVRPAESSVLLSIDTQLRNSTTKSFARESKEKQEQGKMLFVTGSGPCSKRREDCATPSCLEFVDCARAPRAIRIKESTDSGTTWSKGSSEQSESEDAPRIATKSILQQSEIESDRDKHDLVAEILHQVQIRSNDEYDEHREFLQREPVPIPSLHSDSLETDENRPSLTAAFDN